jgi:hypothetical protein
LTAEDAWAKKASNKAKRKAILNKRRVRVTRNKIKNTQGIAARKQERDRKKRVEALQKAKEFVLVHLLKAIPDLELSITEADIDLQLRKALISTTAGTDLDQDATLWKIETIGSGVDTNAEDGLFASQPDYVSLLGFDNRDWNYLDADEDADIGLF